MVLLRLKAATSLRERIRKCTGTLASTATATTASSVALGRRHSSWRHHATVALQLDYYMSPQFAGVACALVNDFYTSTANNNGIIANLGILPTCPVGLELERVRQHQDANPRHVTIGCVEQNVFIPTLVANPALKTTAIAAMFRRSPLCIASKEKLDDTGRSGSASSTITVGAHEDTVELLQRIFPQYSVIATPRATKNTDLLSGKLNGIQAYTTTEVPTLNRRLLGGGQDQQHLPVVVTHLEGGLNNGTITNLGYGQMLFTANENLQHHDDDDDDCHRRQVVQAFLTATFQGWEMAIRHPEQAVEMMRQAKKMLFGMNSNSNHPEDGNDHWHDSHEFELEMTRLCNDFVKETFEGDRYGVIHPTRFDEATTWLLQDSIASNSNPASAAGFGLDTTIWQPSQQLLPGNELARVMMETAKASAVEFAATHDRKPSVVVITVGQLERYPKPHVDRRLQIYSNTSNSWFSKTQTGQANGFDVTEINLDESSTTTQDLLKQINDIMKDEKVDGIQLMWPLPDHIDAARVFNAIDMAKDVDGIHYIGQLEVGNDKAYMPVTVLGVAHVLQKYNVPITGKRVLVIGRSPMVGSPLAHYLRACGAAVTVLHSQVPRETLKTLVQQSDVIIPCVGSPGLVPAEWIADGAHVINVGSTFVKETDSLHSDIAGDLTKIKHGSVRYSPVPGGVGPTSASALFLNVAQAAWDRAAVREKKLKPVEKIE